MPLGYFEEFNESFIFTFTYFFTEKSCLLEINGSLTNLALNQTYIDPTNPCQIVMCQLSHSSLPKINYTEIICNITCENVSYSFEKFYI
jgi:hypothetical protein